MEKNFDTIVENQYQELIRESRDDLKLCDTSYNTEHFSDSIYLFQQSVEKSAKALIVLTENRLFTKEELMAVEYKSINTYENYANVKKDQLIRIKKIIKENPSLNTEFRKIVMFKDFDKMLDSVIDSINTFLSELNIIRQKNLKDLINDIIVQEFVNKIEKDHKDYNNLLSNIKRQEFLVDDWKIVKTNLLNQFLLENYYDVRSGNIQINEKEHKEIEKLFEDMFEKNKDVFIDLAKMYLEITITEFFIYRNLPNLLIITLPQIKICPSTDSTLTSNVHAELLPIIKKLPELIDSQNKILDMLDKLKNLISEYSKRVSIVQ